MLNRLVCAFVVHKLSHIEAQIIYKPAHKFFELITSLCAEASNSHAEVSSQARGLYLHPYFVYVRSKGSGESVYMCMFI